MKCVAEAAAVFSNCVKCCKYFSLFRFRAMFWPIRPTSRFSRSPQLRLSRFYFHKMTSNLPNHDKEELVYPLLPLLLPFYPSIYSFLPFPLPLLSALMDAGVLICSQTKPKHLVNVELLTKTIKEKKKSSSQKLVR